MIGSPAEAGGLCRPGEARSARLCLKLPFAAKLQGVSELDWGPDAFMCCPLAQLPWASGTWVFTYCYWKCAAISQQPAGYFG